MDGYQGFVTSLPAALQDGASHSVYIYALDTAGGANPLLVGSPRTISGCLPPPTVHIQFSFLDGLKSLTRLFS
jgi:hypothetical protein